MKKVRVINGKWSVSLFRRLKMKQEEEEFKEETDYQIGESTIRIKKVLNIDFHVLNYLYIVIGNTCINS